MKRPHTIAYVVITLASLVFATLQPHLGSALEQSAIVVARSGLTALSPASR
ncbi:hypothetical protein C7444_105109 [Sphaerotilus hippei]|uniref:Uncharacterized protein n=1 Tax=Sphaerotilus hippei TaxID=744406 RepID=A0A318H6D3_9BURK|nr:hypothetical protein [Sphaerotilus hippei]PXW97010.1 hypothetical protein C7444_105109 [Sphaerotilus hippei]